MQTNNILSAQLIDIIFDGHNKDYGAYELRKNYSKRINRALYFTMLITAVICGGAILANSYKANEQHYIITPGPVVTEILPEKKIPPPKPEKLPEIKPIKTEVYTAPQIKPDVDVQKPPPTQDALVDTKIGDEKHDGIIDDGIRKPEEIDNGKGIVDVKKNVESDEPFTAVEVEAKFNGNWKAFLERNLNPNVPLDNGAPAGNYSVIVQFVVDKEGNVSDIQTLTNHGYGMEAEAVRVLKKATKWEPAIQNNIKVKAYRRQVIIFQVLEE